jgi:hypothetical protein
MSGRRDALEVIVQALAPFLGGNMARAAVQANAAKLGLHAPLFVADDIERLLAAMRPGLAVFVGRDKTDKILDDARRQVAGTP